MSTQHSVLSASGASHWKDCRAYYFVNDPLYPTTNEYADEGTALHSAIDAILRGETTIDQVTSLSFRDGSIRAITDKQKQMLEVAYDCALEVLGGASPTTETRVYYGDVLGVDNKYAFGTVDLFTVKDDTLIVYDFKFGFNKVEAFANYQLALYAIGVYQAVHKFETINKIIVGVIQPQVSAVAEYTEYTPEELQHFVDTLKPSAKRFIDLVEGRAKLEEQDYNPTCVYCKAQGIYNEYAENNMKALFDNNIELSPDIKGDKLSYWLDRLPEIDRFVKAIREQAKQSLIAGERIPGYKLGEGRLGDRKWSDESSAVGVMTLLNLDPYKKEVKSPTEFDREVKKLFKGDKEGYAGAMAEANKAITRAAGKPTVVREVENLF